MKNLGLAMKIGLGFGLLLTIAGILGTIGVLSMSAVEKEAVLLSAEFIPEVAIADDLHGAANRLMYAMRGYTLSEEDGHYHRAQKELKGVQAAIARGRDLAGSTTNLSRLSRQLDTATTAVATYKELMKKMLAANTAIAQARAILDAEAATYMSNCGAFLDAQNENFKSDLADQQKIINGASEIFEIGMSARMLNFKSRALQDPDILLEAIFKIESIQHPVNQLREAANGQDGITDEIGRIDQAARAWQNNMETYYAVQEESRPDATQTAGIEAEMDQNAATLLQYCNTFLIRQKLRLKTAMLDRNTKINLVTRIMNTGNATRVESFKSQALRQTEHMRDAMTHFDEMNALFDDLEAITQSPENLQRIANTKNAAENYKNAMQGLLQNGLLRLQLEQELETAGNTLVKACVTTAEAGMKQASAVANNATSGLKDASRIMTGGQILATLLGIAIAIFITLGITRPINRVSLGLEDSADQVSSAATQVSSASQSLAEGASEQAAAIEETSSSMEQMASMTQQNADNAGQADALMKSAGQIIQEANNNMQDLTCSMADISKAGEETSKIIKTIDEIAFQTNLLALNAAVEAARAGDAGAGFAVVADEVRNLALRASDAAKNTAALIEDTVNKVSNGTKLVDLTNASFAEVASSAEKVGKLVAEIAAASGEQAQGIEQINQGIGEMDKVVQQNAANAEESASASEELNAQAEHLKDYVTDLIKLIKGGGNNAAGGNTLRGHDAIAHQTDLELAVLQCRDTNE